MAETAFDLAYEGDALADGRMPVRDLAPALLALGEIFTEASQVVAPGRPPAALEIQATSEGSFVVHLLLGGWDAINDIFTSDDATTLVNLKEAIVGGTGLFVLIKRLFGRAVKQQEAGPEPGEITITLDDGTRLTVPKAAWDLYGNVEVRKKTRKVIEPLSKPGVESVVFEVDEQVTVRLDAADAPAFELPASLPEPLGENELELVLSIVSVAFKDDNKWRLSDGQQTFFAIIHDEAFLQRVAQGEPFRSGDMLRCSLRIVQTKDDEGLHTEYEVLEVLDHIPRQTQMQIDLTGEPEPDERDKP
jgi:hypothetical protein